MLVVGCGWLLVAVASVVCADVVVGLVVVEIVIVGVTSAGDRGVTDHTLKSCLRHFF